MTKPYGKALSMRFAKEAPPLGTETEIAPAIIAPAPHAEPASEAVGVESGRRTPPEPRRRRILDAGEEARLGKRKTKRVAGLLRGGRNSPDWGEAVEWMGAKVPDGLNDRLAILARAHKLHRWQVLVEAIDCFEKLHGPKAKTSTP